MNKLEKFINSTTPKEYIVIALQLVCFFPAINTGLEGSEIFKSQGSYSLFTLFVGLLITAVALAFNIRKSFGYAIILLLFYQFISLVQIILGYAERPFSNQLALDGFRTSRNIFLLILFVYLFLHIPIHTIKFLLAKNYKMFTKSGVILGVVIVLVTIFNFVLAGITADILTVFSRAYKNPELSKKTQERLSPLPSSQQNRLYLQSYKEIKMDKSSPYHYLAVYATADVLNTSTEELMSQGYDELAYLVDNYTKPTKKLLLETNSVPGMGGLGTNYHNLNDQYFLYCFLGDCLIFKSTTEIVTQSIVRENEGLQTIKGFGIYPQEQQLNTNPIKVFFGGEGIGTAGEARLDVTTGKIIPDSVRITNKYLIQENKKKSQ